MLLRTTKSLTFLTGYTRKQTGFDIFYIPLPFRSQFLKVLDQTNLYEMHKLVLVVQTKYPIMWCVYILYIVYKLTIAF